jgi:hypothetical protein
MKVFKPCGPKVKCLVKAACHVHYPLKECIAYFTDGEEKEYFLYKGKYIVFLKKVFNSSIISLLDSLDIHTLDRLGAVWLYGDQLFFLWKAFVPKKWSGQAVLLASNGELGMYVVKKRFDGQYSIYPNKNGGYSINGESVSISIKEGEVCEWAV